MPIVHIELTACIKFALFLNPVSTAVVACWLEGPSREQEVVGSIPGRDRPKYLKLEVGLVAFPLGAQDYGNSTTTGPPVSG